MENLKKYKNKFLEKLEYHCNVYKLIGNGTTESPMWLQLRNSFDIERNRRAVLLFVNSQRDSLGFEIELEDDDNWIEYEAFKIAYDYFRELKYTYIQENHPTIYKQIR